MTVTSADLSQWAAHRRAVVFTVSRRVPGVDPELAASRGLELLCVELLKHGDVSDPVVFWGAAAVDVALAMANEEPLPDHQAALSEVSTAPVQRALDFEVLTAAMERLSAGDQQLLWDHHVGSRPVAAIADEIGVLPYAAKRRLRRAENRLASSFAETHTGTADNLECESTRASMHDFVRNRLLPGRRQKVEDHMVQCAGCTRAFVDVRESYWMLRAAAPVLLLGAATAAKASAAVGAAGAAATGAGLGSGIAALGTRVALTVRSALTDPISLTATVAGGLFLTSAVTTGVAGDAGAVPTPFETGVVSVSTPRDANAAVPDAGPTSHAEEQADRPESTRFVPPGLAAGNGTPPGLAKQDGVPPGLAKQDVPPGLAKQDGAPADQASDTGDSPSPAEPSTGTPQGTNGTDRTPPGLAKQDGTPPGLAKQDSTPPGQAKQDDAPPGKSGAAARPDRSDEPEKRSHPGRGSSQRTEDGHPGNGRSSRAQRESWQEPAGPSPDSERGHRLGPPDHVRSRSTSTS